MHKAIAISFFALSILIEGVTASGNSSSAPDLGKISSPGSGDGNEKSTYDDENDGNEDLGYDYGDPQDLPADYDGKSNEDTEEWNGFDGVICADGSHVDRSNVCNGVRDCYDCSDEENCTNVAETMFFCHAKGGPPLVRDYTFDNPKCISMARFCDGMADCSNGADEKKFGTGFKCMIKDRFQTCILPQYMVCDGVSHCEDKTDMCAEDTNQITTTVTDWNSTLEADSRFSKIPYGFFRCLNSDLLISIRQLCDGEFDCPDLSDECLCEVRKSRFVEEVCGGMCTKQLWVDQPENKNCNFCAQGEIFWATAPTKTPNIEQKRDCYTPREVIEILENFKRAPGSVLSQERDRDVIECLDQTLTRSIRARRCDGRPECFFGEDECGIDCKNGGNEEWGSGSGDSDNSSDPEFCRLLTPDISGFACASTFNEDGTRRTNLNKIERIFNERLITICDGYIECQDGSDEAYCPTRSRCSGDTNNTNAGTFDESQRCDGVPHCDSGEDENPTTCSYSTTSLLPCDETTDGNSIEYFHVKNLLDGNRECSTGSDECPPFLSRITQIKAKVHEGMGETGNMQFGISSHNKVIDNLVLQIFMIACAFIGISALAVSLVLSFYNLVIVWMRFSTSGVKDRSVWTNNCIIYARELVVNLGMTISKGLVCGYFAYIKIERAEDANYSLVDLEWRSSTSCSVAGTIVMIGTQVPIFSLAFFAGGYLLFRRYCLKEGCGNASIPGNHEGVLSVKKPLAVKALLAVTCVLLLTLIWLPVVLVSGLLTYPTFLNERTQTYGRITGASTSMIFRANLIDKETASQFASTVLAIRNHTLDSKVSNIFTFPEWEKVVDSSAPFLEAKFLGSYGYFAHSGACLPGFLVHVNGGKAPIDIAVSNSWTWGISLAIITTDVVIILITAVLITKCGAGICKTPCCESQYNRHESYSNRILNHTFSRFALIEILTWGFIIILFFVKAVVGNGFSDYAYTVCCLVVLGLNCGMVTPFVLLKRKFRLQRHVDLSGINRRSQPFIESTKIVEITEENESEEEKPLTNGKAESAKEEVQNDESQNLVKEVDDETTKRSY